MGMTMTQKLLAAHAGLDRVEAGQLIEAKLDLIMANDITGPAAIREYRKLHDCTLFSKDKIVLIPDHFAPSKDISSAEQCAELRRFARENEISHYYEVGEAGIEHALLPEKGLITAGEACIGADSHTCTYGALGAFATGVGSTDFAAAMATGKAWFKVPSALRFVLSGKPQRYVSGKDIILYIIGLIGVEGARYMSMEFTGDGIQYLSMDDRFTIANMTVEAGAKNGIFPVDEQTEEYIREHSKERKEYQIYSADEDAVYDKTYIIELDKLVPVVACPSIPSNIKNAAELSEIVPDQIVIGSCTNGRISDMRIAATILKGKHVAVGCRLIVIPATIQIYLQCIKEGLAEIFITAGAVFSVPTCGPCLGGHMGVLASGEIAVSTTNRNFTGRMGHPDSLVYLASPAVAAATAVAGYITVPQNEFVMEVERES